MNTRHINAENAPAPHVGYSQACEVAGATRLLYVSGQIPVSATGVLSEDFEQQCRQCWANVEAQLAAADMGLDHLVKVTTFLADRRHAAANRRIRAEVLGPRKPALTVIIAELFEEGWRVEIEAIAAA